MRSTKRGAIILGVVLAATSLVGCSSKSKSSASQSEPSGAVGLQLVVGDVTVTSVAYTLRNATTTLTGRVDVSASTSLDFVIPSVPPGSGYVLTLDVAESDVTGGGATCHGVSGSFDVVALATVPVAIRLTCTRRVAVEPGTGNVVVGGTVNECPYIQSVTASVPVGNTVPLHVGAVDPVAGPGDIVFNYTGATGLSGSNPVLTCATPGARVHLSVSVSDGDPVCNDTFPFDVTCPGAAADGGAAGSTGTGGNPGTGGAAGAGGSADAGGTGGAGGAGGSTGTGGTPGSGGSLGTGGTPGSGGSAGTGGAGGSGGSAGTGGAGGAGGSAGTGGAGGAGGSPPCGDTSTTSVCLASRSAACLQCAQDNGCLDPTLIGGTCEGVTGTAASACGTVLASGGAPTEAQVCMRALNNIMTSGCAGDGQETPCLCGAVDPVGCQNGTVTPIGALFPIYQCDLGPAISSVVANFTNPSLGAGMADTIVQCVAAFGCGCL